MSALGDILHGIRQAVLLDHRVNELTDEVRELGREQRALRERMAHLEGLIAGARMSAAAKRLN